jgi:adenylate kinase
VRIAVTGTPGTGKTTATERLDTDLSVIHLNDVIKSEGLSTGVDSDRESLVTDMDAVETWLDGRDDVVFESHLAHNFEADRVVVLRAHPETITERLRQREESEETARENAESEALDVILSEAVQRHGQDSVYEIVTTDREPDAVASAIEAVLDGEREPSAGTVQYTEFL